MTGLAVRLLTAAALAVSAYVHLDLSTSPYSAAGQLTLGALFLGQAVVAIAVAVWVLARPSRAAYAARDGRTATQSATAAATTDCARNSAPSVSCPPA